MSNHSFLEFADRIGAGICRYAIWHDGRCNWVARSGRNGEDSLALSPSLYSGTAGIALFLGRLASATGEKIFRETADAALRQALSQQDRLQSRKGIGFYSGLGGVAYALSEGGPASCAEGMKLGQSALPAPSGAENDLMVGHAGVVVAALHLHQLEVAVQHGEILIAAARRSGAGWSWRTIADGAPPERPDLNGFAHGVAGIAWALMELWHATGEQKYRAAAEEGFRYEQSWFSPEHGNWPDLRKFNRKEPAFFDAWCHGAAGIGLSRLRAAQLTGDPQYQAQADAALKTVERGLHAWGSCCLCHGLFGSIDVLLYSGTQERIALARGAAQSAIDRYPAQRLPWLCDMPDHPETPGLMTGLAGIGHTLLRLADPAVPSPLIVSC